MKKIWWCPALPNLVLAGLLAMTACGGGGVTGSSPPPPNPVPNITSLSPPSSTAGAAAQTLTINGTNFLSSSTVTYNNAAHSATFANSTQLTISLSAADQATAGTYPVVVTNPSPGGGPSNSVNFTVNNAVPGSSLPPFKKQVIYLVVTDRFYDGNPANDNCPQSSGLYDSTKTNWNLYWGGDLAGIQNELPYLGGMGLGALWISPPMTNIKVSIPDSSGNPTAGYHGYWPHDFMTIEDHFGDCSNSWTAFDNLVTAAHSSNLKLIVDFPANDSNPDNAGEYGSLYNNGAFVAACNNDPNGVFHHNPDISNFEDRYQLQYYTLEDLCDFNQENSTTDSYLKTSLAKFQENGADAFRIDAAKHTTWGWEYSMVNSVLTSAPSFFFGEWEEDISDSLFDDSAKFANKSGMALYDYPLGFSIRDVFGSNSSFTEIDSTLNTVSSAFTWPNDLVTWVDNQDQPRLLSINGGNTSLLNEALAFILTCRGIPQVYYGDEQYLHNDTDGGGDPYNRLWMSSFSTTTTAYKLIQQLGALRAGSNDALAYGTMLQRWINSDVYIYERQFFNDVVLTAINKSQSTGYAITGLYTALPAGNYSDYLSGLLGGFPISVGNGGGNNPVTAFTLPANTVAVWQTTGTVSAPEVGSIEPTVCQPGCQVTINGKGFGSASGSVLFSSSAASIKSWSDSSVTFTVPSVTNGVYQVQLKNSGGAAANSIQFTVLTATLIPVTFTVNNAQPTNYGDYIYLTGSTVELGNFGTTFATAVGPMLDPNYPNWFINASMPACQNIQFKFIDIQANGNVISESGNNHTYTVPCSGTGSVNVNWQY